MGLQWSLAVPTSYQWQRASILAALGPGPCQARFQRGGKKKRKVAGIKQRLDYPLNMSLSRTVHLWIPRGAGRRKRHNSCAWLLYTLFFFLFFFFSLSLPSHSCLVCRLSITLKGQIKFEIKSNPVASILTQSKIHHLTLCVTLPKTFPVTFIPSHLPKSSNNPVESARCGVLLWSGSFLLSVPSSQTKRLTSNSWGIPPQLQWLDVSRDRSRCSSARAAHTFSSLPRVCSGAADSRPFGVFTTARLDTIHKFIKESLNEWCSQNRKE